MWVNQSFLLVDDIEAAEDGGLRLLFQCLRKQGLLVFLVTPDCHVSIHCQDMDLVADIIQSLASYLNLEDLKVRQMLNCQLL